MDGVLSSGGVVSVVHVRRWWSYDIWVDVCLYVVALRCQTCRLTVVLRRVCGRVGGGPRCDGCVGLEWVLAVEVSG